MAQDLKDLTRGPLAKQLLLFSLPLMVSNVLQVLFNMSDVAVVGRFGSSTALGSVGSTTILVTLYVGLLIGMGNGINVVVAHSLGARNERDVREAVHTSLLLSLLTGILVMVFSLLLSPFLLRLLNTKDEFMAGANLYLRIYSCGFPALAVYNFANAVYSAAGNTKKPLLFLTASGVINVCLNVFFVVVVRLDVAGVAIASIISQYITAALVTASLFRAPEVYGLRRSDLGFSARQARRIVPLGAASALQYSIFAIANLFIQTGVNQFNATLVSGNSAAGNADTLVYDLLAAFYVGCSSFIGQNYGAHNKERILKSYLISLGYSFGAGAIMGVLFLVLGRPFLSLFTTDPQVVEAGLYRLTIMSFSYCVSAFMDCSIAASRGLGKSLVPTVVVILGSCVFRIAWVYTVFAHFGTPQSLYLLYIFSWAITAIPETLYFLHCYRRQTSGFAPAESTQPAA